MEAGHALASTRGRISISSRAVAQIVGHTAAEYVSFIALLGAGFE